MALSKSPRPPFTAGPVLSPITVAQGDAAPQQRTWILAATGALPAQPASWLSPEPRAASEWRFGDATLIRDVRSMGPSSAGAQRGPRFKHQGCVALLGGAAADVSQTLFVSPHAGLALAALEQSARRFGSAEERLLLLLPRGWLEGAGAAGPVQTLETEAGPGALLAGFMRQLAGQSRPFGDDQARSLAVAVRALVEACIAPAGRSLAATAPSTSSGTVERARQIVQRHMGSPEFGPPQLGRLLAMSRSKLYRLLDGDGGVAHFINRERLLQARRDLTTPGEPLSVHAIASRVGFRDHSTFSRAFRRQYGCSPSRWRERSQPSDQDVTSPGPAHQGARRAERPVCIHCERGGENGMNSPDLGFWADPAP
ncbi:helix-turn-helix transcriptional regulator [Bosea sp. R86505]|uniref:helix-turn-helix transcriptional regulator n=1 Tax=Bosea sp. R86505 TaxID=3101710 RepID=UPI003671F8D0